MNVLRDPWVPLDVGASAPRYVSYEALLTGTADAPDLWHTRDDLKVFARILLSALTQHLFPVKTLQALRKRVTTPMTKAQVGPVLARAAEHFELLGPGRRFMQVQPPKGTAPRKAGVGELIFGEPRGNNHLLFRPPAPVQRLCQRCVLLALYGANAFAASGGRGYSPGVRSTPPLTTLVWRPSVRESVWVNVLADDTLRTDFAGRYARQDRLPWCDAKRSEKGGPAIGLAEGLFWMPRAVWLDEARQGEGRSCDLCGADDEALIEQLTIAPHSKVTKFWLHPFSPYLQEGVKAVTERGRLVTTGQPVWTGLLDLVFPRESETYGKGAKATKTLWPAPVVAQAVKLCEGLGNELALVCFAYRYRQAKLLFSVHERRSLSMDRFNRPDGEPVQYARQAVTTADLVLGAVRSAIRSAVFGSRGAKTPTLPVGRVDRFWLETEPAYQVLLDLLDGRPDHDRDAVRQWEHTLASTAQTLFDEEVSAIAFDNAALRRTARARTRLRHDLVHHLPTLREGPTP